MPAPADNVVLIGYRGTGKSTIGRHLAALLSWPLIDLDELIEARAGRTIADIFASAGEAAFRDAESQALAAVAGQHQVLSTGGGIVLRPENRDRLRTLGTVIWLRARPETILARLEQDAATAARRPNLTPRGGIEEIRLLLAQRLPLYAQLAQWTFDTDDAPPEELARSIWQTLFA